MGRAAGDGAGKRSCGRPGGGSSCPLLCKYLRWRTRWGRGDSFRGPGQAWARAAVRQHKGLRASPLVGSALARHRCGSARKGFAARQSPGRVPAGSELVHRKHPWSVRCLRALWGRRREQELMLRAGVREISKAWAEPGRVSALETRGAGKGAPELGWGWSCRERCTQAFGDDLGGLGFCGRETGTKGGGMPVRGETRFFSPTQ